MKKLNFVLLFFVLSTHLFSQSITLTGPDYVSYCNVEDITFNTYGPYVDDEFDDVNWRYKFSLWTDGNKVAEYTDQYIAQWTIDYDDYNFESGPYQVKLEVQYQFVAFWITDETVWSNGINLQLYGETGEYDASKIENRTVSGDFDNDGYIDDIAAFYDYGSNNTTLHVWESNTNYYTYQGNSGWWSSSSFNAQNITGRVVSGDFDRDGYHDDIAAFYDYGNNLTKIFIWKSNGSSFVSGGVWWTSGSGSSGFNSNQINGSIVSGDFDRDGYIDDIATFYDHGSYTTKAHIFQSTGSYLNSSGIWYDSGTGNFDLAKCTQRFVSGDFDRDGYHDDIVTFYETETARTKSYVWTSTGSSLNWPSSWYDSGSGNFNATKIKNRVVSGDFDKDGYVDDIAGFYDFGSAETKTYVWTSTGSSLNWPSSWYDSGSGNFNANQIDGKIVPVDVNNDGYQSDMSCVYDYGSLSLRIFTWLSNSSSFSSPRKDWEICNPSPSSLVMNTSKIEKHETKTIRIFPNPTNGIINIEYAPTDIKSIVIYAINGKELYRKNINNTNQKSTTLHLKDNLANGIYFLKIFSNSNMVIDTQKIVVN